MSVYIPPALRRCTDVVLTSLADQDILTYDAATGLWGPITRAAFAASLPPSGALAFFRGSQTIGAGIGTTAGLDLSAATQSILINTSLTGDQVNIPAGTFQWELTATFSEGTVASLTNPVGSYGPHLRIDSGGSWPNIFMRVLPVPDMVTVANYAGGYATAQSTQTFAVATLLSLNTVTNNMSAGSGITFDYFLTIRQVGA